MYNVIPLIKTHHSLHGRSIINTEKCDDKIDLSRPISLFTIAKSENLEPTWILDDSMSGFMTIYKGFKELEKEFRFGWRFTVCNDVEQKNEESLKTESKLVVFALNTEGYYDLIKFHNAITVNKETFYYQPRADSNLIKKYLTNNLAICVPFFDSFLANNTLKFSSCLPNLDNITLTFFSESHDLPFCPLIQNSVDKYVKNSGYEIVKTHSIYYYSAELFKSWQLMKIISKRSNINKPELSNCSIDDFSFEKWKELNYGNR